jgi:hypothetical protein
MLVTAAGTFAAVMNPSLLQQGAAFIGLELPLNSDEAAEKPSEEDQLAQFLAQYPAAHKQDHTLVPAMNVPMVVIPELTQPPPTPSPITPFPSPVPPPPSYAAPATPFPPPTPPSPVPVMEPVVPVYTNNLNNWDSEVAAPIYAPPVEEYQQSPQPDWSGPSQSYQEQVQAPAPQTSVYVVAPAEGEIFPIVHEVVPGSAQTKQVEPYAPPQPNQPPPQISPSGATIHTSATLIEDVPMHGTEIAAKVGREVILMGDILPKLRRTAQQIVADRLEKMPETQRAMATQEEIEKFTNDIAADLYPEVLEEQILFALVYGDYDMSMDRATKNMYNDKMGDEFDRNVIPEMMKEFNVDNLAALKKHLEHQLGSSLEKERRLWIREEIVKQWIGQHIGRATGDSTHDEMMTFYEKNKAGFTTAAKAKWQEMTVLFSRHDTEQDAWKKIVWMGNEVALQGAPFEEIAKAHSDGFTASDGGVREWVTRGSLTSVELEQAIFSQPVGQLSPNIIKSAMGLHLVRVLERHEEKITPFIEAQGTIRELIKRQRGQRYQEEYFTELKRRFPTQVIKDRIDFRVNAPRSASSVR